jgi:hypothetical protein
MGCFLGCFSNVQNKPDLFHKFSISIPYVFHKFSICFWKCYTMSPYPTFRSTNLPQKNNSCHWVRRTPRFPAAPFSADSTPGLVFLGKIKTGNHGFYHQIEGFPIIQFSICWLRVK